jgi:hypothetical protein
MKCQPVENCWPQNLSRQQFTCMCSIFFFAYINKLIKNSLFIVKKLIIHFNNKFIHFFIHQCLYSPLLGPSLFVSFVLFFTQTVELLGRVISPSQGRYLHTGQHKHRTNAHTDIHALSGALEQAKVLQALDREATVIGLLTNRVHKFCDIHLYLLRYRQSEHILHLLRKCVINSQWPKMLRHQYKFTIFYFQHIPVRSSDMQRTFLSNGCLRNI